MVVWCLLALAILKCGHQNEFATNRTKPFRNGRSILLSFQFYSNGSKEKKSIKQRKSKASQQQSGQYTHPRKVAIGINFISICFYSVRLFVRLLIFFEHFTTFKFGKWHAKRERDGDANENKGNTNAFFFQRTFKMQTLISMLAFY